MQRRRGEGRRREEGRRRTGRGKRTRFRVGRGRERWGRRNGGRGRSEREGECQSERGLHYAMEIVRFISGLKIEIFFLGSLLGNTYV